APSSPYRHSITYPQGRVTNAPCTPSLRSVPQPRAHLRPLLGIYRTEREASRLIALLRAIQPTPHLGSRPFSLMTATASGERNKLISACAVARSLALAGTPAANTVVACESLGAGQRHQLC